MGCEGQERVKMGWEGQKETHLKMGKCDLVMRWEAKEKIYVKMGKRESPHENDKVRLSYGGVKGKSEGRCHVKMGQRV